MTPSTAPDGDGEDRGASATITPTQDGPGPCPQGHKTVSTAEWPAHPSTWRWFTRCTCCGWQGPPSETEAGSIAEWNTRACNAYPELVAALEAAAVRFETVRARIHRLGATPGMKALELADYTRQCEAEIDAALRKAGVL